jgi:histidine phosphotransfer protein HptB
LGLTGLRGEILDPDQIWERVDGDEHLLRSLIAIFRPDAARLLSEIHVAIAARDAIGLERAAHGLRGSTGVFAASRAVDIATDLEEMGRVADFEAASLAHIRLVAAVRDVLTTLDVVAGDGPR